MCDFLRFVLVVTITSVVAATLIDTSETTTARSEASPQTATTNNISGSRLSKNPAPVSPVPRIKVLVDTAHIEKSLKPFWGSTGLCPPAPHSSAGEFLLSLDERQNLALIGSLPHNAVQQVRMHWLLDLVNASMSNGYPQWEFDKLDEVLDILHLYQLRPGFELMGNPGDIFTNLENSTQVGWWKDLVYATANRYAGRYGVPYVESWLWESWNEPDHHDFDNLNITVQGFLNYWDASRAGLDAVSPTMVLGGPGGSCRNPHFSRICWALLDHCNQGKARIDFISFHKKGHEDWEYILETEMATIQHIRDTYPNLRDIPIINDESDFVVGWSRSYDWRADARYATLVVNAIAGHLKSPIMSFNFHLMSFDNAFLSFQPLIFKQRTLTARLTVLSTCRGCPLIEARLDHNTAQTDHSATVHPWNMLASEGNTSKDYNSRKKLLQKSLNVGEREMILDVRSNWESCTVMSFSNGTDNTSVSRLMDITIQLPHQLVGEVLWYVVYSIGREIPGPFETWMNQGESKEPNRDQLALLRSSEGATRRGPQSIVGVAGELQLSLNLTTPEVILVHICRQFDSSPGQVINLNTLAVTSVDVLITWSDENLNTRCVLSYEVQLSPQEDGPWSRISPGNVTDNNFVFSIACAYENNCSSVVGWYRVRALTYWGTAGNFSDPTYHQH